MIRVAYLPGPGTRGPSIQTNRLVQATSQLVSWVPCSVPNLKGSIPQVDAAYMMHSGTAKELQAAGIPTVCHVTTSVSKPNLVALRETVSTVIVVSPSLKDLCEASNVVLLENSVPDEFCPGPREIPRKLDLPVILFCGAVCKSKGIDILIQAVKDLPCELWLVGSVHPAIQVKAKNIVIWGHQTDLLPFYRAADLFVLPSRSEGMSLALLEAMATGLPCIASDIQANQDTLRGAGILCGVTPLELRAAIQSLLESKERRSQLGASALTVAKTRKFSDWCNQVVTTLEGAAGCL